MIRNISSENEMRRCVVTEFNRLLLEYLTLRPTNNPLDPLQTIRQLQNLLRWMARIERRIYIRKALAASEQDFPNYQQGLGQWDGPGREATIDCKCVTLHIDQGSDLFAGLRRVGRSR